ncbi:hypothetical protein [Deminuibacter soli]|uniref:DUF4595 domain-containing protein n=1 Tax=Deminuibacter soli TaxID=2291815 RepID=A0A3E1NLM6_9BACT|nr:hypothetical protein [Deminuibacter soli]RFM28698.1 hypothetical protein DXN05_07885 [Deminuibacter soli]
MKRFIMSLLLLASCLLVRAQYYYNDILAATQTNMQYRVLKANHIQKVSARSLENDNAVAAGFELNQQISRDAGKITTRTDYPSAGHSLTVSWYQDNHLVKTEDSSARVLTTTTYTYTPQYQVNTITIVTLDTFMHSQSSEIHRWEYRDNQPVRMLKIKDGNDTTVVEFIADEQGNVAEEHWNRKGHTIETYYYYYNNNHQLTDIVRYNARVKKLLPDYLFQYDTAGRISQMTQISMGNTNYMIWYYLFDDTGLKQQELCYNKKKELIGKIEYSYK